jgi:hypothetical protein
MHKTALVLLALSALATNACGGAQAQALSPDNQAVKSQEDLINYRTALEDLRKDPRAAEATPDLQRAALWIQLVESRLADDVDDQKQHVELTMRAIRGQLVMVKSYFARRTAEAALEDKRADYERRVRNARDLLGEDQQ